MKTVIVSLSSQAVFRNLFFFPGSFFKRAVVMLEADHDQRLVIVVPSRLREKYMPFIGPLLHERLLFIPVEVVLKKTIVQKLFVFFFSYLIYTGTTKIMATLGTRPDEPPAGGNRYLAPLKIAIARTFGRSRMLKQKIVPSLFMRIFRDRPFERIFTDYHPDRVMIGHLYGWFDQLLIQEAKRNAVPTVGMPAGWDHVDKYFLPMRVDTLLVPSEQVAAHAFHFQAYQRESIRVVGYSYFDFILNPEFIHSRSDTLSRLGFAASARYILYVSGSAYCPDEPDIIETIVKWIDEGKFGQDVYLVIRPYQGGRTKDKTFDEEKFKRFEDHARVRIYRSESWMDAGESARLVNIIRHCGVMLAVFTTMALEAAILDRSLVAVAFDGYAHRPWNRSIRRFEDFTHFQDVRKTGALKIAYSFDELFSALHRSLTQPSWAAKERKLLREKLCSTLDGRTSERILGEVFKKE